MILVTIYKHKVHVQPNYLALRARELYAYELDGEMNSAHLSKKLSFWNVTLEWWLKCQVFISSDSYRLASSH